ncbi:GyrI-like domain-containing protein [Chromobacterium sp. IIBBL 290-4]|uniref:GyrI-like domain-containing protein n=1 Tax=Chromobacterium sp. IIBBL 290-4 TaxID=2953890 RepID=UPI0020B69794|nr:GyrI-like domain-containing protein [Chromobacterium sp. IIBBL 290-4]UTH72917.1 GyrI-like domain-containing protein [Chromobacterium sp. IIBBL 290-4]
MDPIIIDHPGLALVGYSIATRKQGDENLQQIPAFWDDYAARLRQPLLAALQRPHAPEYGVVCDFDSASERFRYLIAMECPDERALPEGCERRRIAPAKYAVFSTPPAAAADFGQAIARTWQHIYQEWLPSSSKWRHGPGETFERYDSRCAPGQETLQMDIYIPVQSKR